MWGLERHRVSGLLCPSWHTKEFSFFSVNSAERLKDSSQTFRQLTFQQVILSAPCSSKDPCDVLQSALCILTVLLAQIKHFNPNKMTQGRWRGTGVFQHQDNLDAHMVWLLEPSPAQAVNPKAHSSHNPGSVSFYFIVVASGLLRTSTQSNPSSKLNFSLFFWSAGSINLKVLTWRQIIKSNDRPLWIIRFIVSCSRRHAAGRRCNKVGVNVSELHSPVITAEWIS